MTPVSTTSQSEKPFDSKEQLLVYGNAVRTKFLNYYAGKQITAIDAEIHRNQVIRFLG